MDIVEFLRARIAEDPVRITEEDMSSMTTHNHPYAFMPHAPRAIREKEAKTTIVSAYELLAARPHGMAQALDQALWSVKVVVSVYANHPDYDESWRP